MFLLFTLSKYSLTEIVSILNSSLDITYLLIAQSMRR